MLLSQCQGLKQVLGLVYHLWNGGLLIWHPLQTAYKNENSTTFWYFIFSLWRTFRASFVTGKFTFHALFLCLFTYIWCSFPLRADWPKLTALSTGSHRGTGGRIQITEMWLQALLLFSPCRQSASGELAHMQWRSENSPLFLGLMFDSLTIFCADMEPLSKYSPVMLQFSPATVILIENPGVGWWWSEILTYLFKVYVLTIFFIKISI